MGLRYRKTVSLGKGVRLNFGKTGVSISAGVPGFRKTIHSSGRVTTSVGVPGSGLYYVDTDYIGKKKKQPERKQKHNSPPAFFENTRTNTSAPVNAPVEETLIAPKEISEANRKVSPLFTATKNIQQYSGTESQAESVPVQQIAPAVIPSMLDDSLCARLFENCDIPVSWLDVLTHREPITEAFNDETWHFLHDRAIPVFEGNMETMLEIIERVNPFEDLHPYADDFIVEMEQPDCLDVEFTVKDGIAKQTNIQDAVCSIVIRTARDAFALLPINEVIVNAVQNSKAILSLHCTRTTFASIHFEGNDPSKIIEEVGGYMSYSPLFGFSEVERINKQKPPVQA